MKRSFLSFSAVALAIFVNSSAYGIFTATETFNDDPSGRGWSGVGNQTAPNNYGFSNTDNTGNTVNPAWGSATLEGEMGGRINRGPNSFYGCDLCGPIDFATTDMNVQGVLNLAARGSSTTLNLGWGQGISTVNGDGSDPGAGLYMSWDDGNNGSNGMKARGNFFGIGSANGPSLVAGGPTVPFEMDWDSATRTFTVDVDGSVGTLVLSAGDVGDLPPLTTWGMWSRTNSSPDNSNVLWIDDVRYTTNCPPGVVPEPSTLLLVICSALGLAATRRRVR